MRQCFDIGVRKFVLGCGGSSFSDTGFGCLQALELFEFEKNGVATDNRIQLEDIL
jgi:glycerate kinase